DRPLLDEVADLRASTPTDAAKRIVPDVGEEFAGIDDARSRMSARLGHLLAHETDRIAQLRARPVLARPDRLVDERAEELVRWVARGAELADRSVEDRAQALAHARARLVALSPQATLERGYAIAQLVGPDGEPGPVITAPEDAPEGAGIRLSLAGGRLSATSAGRA
ncbi:MAG: exodeoxyribonuclease VII large subunit, partial [Leucobacter sp.]|nr:exodeoxyribonuclease VII large subunit [Leucobacter sp.]